EPQREPGVAATPGFRDELAAPVRQFDGDLAAVVIIGCACDEPEVDEQVDGAVHAGRADVLALGEGSEGLGAIVEECEENGALTFGDVGVRLHEADAAAESLDGEA